MGAAIGCGPHDAIVVVENVERKILKPAGTDWRRRIRQCAKSSGPIVAIIWLLCASFVPNGVLDASTRAVSIAKFADDHCHRYGDSHQLTDPGRQHWRPPAKPHDAPPIGCAAIINPLFRLIFRPFNRFFLRNARVTSGLVVVA